MEAYIKAFVAALKTYLRENRDDFVSQNDWAGDTEGGFYTEYSFS